MKLPCAATPLYLTQRQFIDAAWVNKRESAKDKRWAALAELAATMALGIWAVAETSVADRWLPILAWSAAATGLFLARRRSVHACAEKRAE